MNQSQRMLEYMLKGHTLTGLQAVQMFGTTTPSKRFSEIRKMLEIDHPSKYCDGLFLGPRAYGYLHSEPRTNGKSRWLEYSVRIVK